MAQSKIARHRLYYQRLAVVEYSNTISSLGDANPSEAFDRSYIYNTDFSYYSCGTGEIAITQS